MKKMSGKINPLRKINWYLMKEFNFGLKRDYPFRTSTIFAKEYFKGKDNLIAIEIGTHRGESAEYFLNKIPFIKKLYCIDPYDKNFVIDGEFAPIHFNVAKKRLKKFSHKCEFIKETSDNALKILKQKEIKADFVYIDGLHTYEQVKRDIENYFPLVKREGIISGHDIQNEEVTKAVFGFCCKNKIIPLIKEMDWIIIKKSKNSYGKKDVGKKLVGELE